MSQITDISADSFHEKVIHADEPVAVEFFSHSCPHCMRFKPVYDQLSEIISREARFFRIDVMLSDENRNLAHSRGVRSVPTVEVFYRGRVIGSLMGNHHIKKASEAVKGFLANREEHIGPSTPLPELHVKPTRESTFKFSFKGCQIRWCKKAEVTSKDKRTITKNLESMSELIQKAMNYTKEKTLEDIAEEIRISVGPKIYLVIEYCQNSWHLGLETTTDYVGEIVGKAAPLICLLEDKDVKAERI